MNAPERQTVERIRAATLYLDGHGGGPVVDLLNIIDRHDRLANEGLTEDERAALVGCLEPGNPRSKYLAMAIERLQAQLVAARDDAAFHAGVAGDALEDRGLPRLEEVRKEAERKTAEECMEIARNSANSTTAGGMITVGGIVYDICRSFGFSVSTVHRYQDGQRVE